jgi:hypothetical protein
VGGGGVEMLQKKGVRVMKEMLGNSYVEGHGELAMKVYGLTKLRKNLWCDNIKSVGDHGLLMLRDAISLVGSEPPWTVEVLNPSCNGFERKAANILLLSVGSAAL